MREEVPRASSLGYGGTALGPDPATSGVHAAAEIGAAWPVFVRGPMDVRKPWPPFSGRAAVIARRLVTVLADEPRRSELARICHWRAGLKWEAVERPRIRDRPMKRLIAAASSTSYPAR